MNFVVRSYHRNQSWQDHNCHSILDAVVVYMREVALTSRNHRVRIFCEFHDSGSIPDPRGHV